METQNPTQSTGMSASTIRQIVLVGILLVGLAALGYDRKMARPAAESAHANLETRIDKAKAKNKRIDKEAAEKFLGKKSSKIRKGEHYQWARYTWMAGVPWRSYDVWVVYEPGQGDKLYCMAVTLNTEPDAGLFDLKRKAQTLNEILGDDDRPDEPGLGLGDGLILANPGGGVPGGGVPGGGGPGVGGGPGRGGRDGGGRGGRGGRGSGGPSREDRERPALDDDTGDEATDDDAGEAKDGEAKDGEAKDGEAKDGEAKDGEAKDGEAKAGEAKDGEEEAAAEEGDAK